LELARQREIKMRRCGFHNLSNPEKFEAFLQRCRKPEWVVYSIPPFGSPDQMLDYLGRYTHRVAISNHRQVSLVDGKATFRWRDYKDGNKRKRMTLDAHEFIRRFLLHVLPHGFVRIRHYGFLAKDLQANPLIAALFVTWGKWLLSRSLRLWLLMAGGQSAWTLHEDKGG
jgi:hypothetical protein